MLAAKKSKSDCIFDLINVILLSMVLLVIIYPLIYVISASLSDPNEVLNGDLWLIPSKFSVEAYVRVFQNKDILTGYSNTIFYTVCGTAVNLVMTILCAYPLSRKDFVGRKIITRLIIFTMFFSGGLIPTYILYRDLGMVNTFWVMIIPGAITVTNVIIMRTFFQNTIPDELYEAAEIDGCGNTIMLIRIVLPLSMPVIAVILLYYAVGHWNQFFLALIYLKDRSRWPLQLILREILLQNNIDKMVEFGAEDIMSQQLISETIKYAVIMVSSVPVLCLYPFLQRYFVKGVMVGAVKG